jgi:hypothetical protein
MITQSDPKALSCEKTAHRRIGRLPIFQHLASPKTKEGTRRPPPDQAMNGIDLFLQKVADFAQQFFLCWASNRSSSGSLHFVVGLNDHEQDKACD